MMVAYEVNHLSSLAKVHSSTISTKMSTYSNINLYNTSKLIELNDSLQY